MKIKFASLIAAILLGLPACVSKQTIDAQIRRIKQEHNVTVRADNPWSRCYLAGNLPNLLERIDKDLDASPQYFKDNLGKVIIEEWFFDNAELYPYPPLLIAGYVNEKDKNNNYPVHMKSRNLLETILFLLPRQRELFLHEAGHSFTLNALQDKETYQSFEREWQDAGGLPHLPPILGQLFFMTSSSLCFPIVYARPPSMPSWYGWVHEWEDLAETNCYLRRHNNNVEFLKAYDPWLYKKCTAVKRWTEGKRNNTGQPKGAP